ncbi:hypothetical protein DWZ09_06330 [Bacteroides cellulosilyticus]|nr:hypothetical protein HMPREF3015_23910 [Bacteroides sp. HMSC073E02]RGQ14642.1 hypothetical protein DWZ09_06330 [Bacteroides cellulosilyticus]
MINFVAIFENNRQLGDLSPADIDIRPQGVSSENLENWNYRDDCVMLMLCFRIACIHVLSVKAIPEPSLESSVFARYFFALHI